MWIQDHIGLGDRVRERDGRHTGTVVMIKANRYYKVRWDDNNWATDGLERDEIEKVDE